MAWLTRFVAGLLVAAPLVVHAHPIHTTLTVLTFDARSRAVTLSIRAFADDFSRVVAQKAGVPVPRDSSVDARGVTAYVRAQFSVEGLTLEPCGIRRLADAYLICFRGTLPSNVSAVKARNAMLTELHSDQVNIVQATSGNEKQTRLFTRTSAPVVLFRD